MDKKNIKYNNTSTNTDDKIDYKIIQKCINQPLLGCDTSYPNIFNHENEIFFTYDGRIFYFDNQFVNSYIFLPFPFKDACFISSDDLKKTQSLEKLIIYFVFLDIQNKLQYTIYNNYTFKDFRIIISRNVIQLLKYKNNVYFLSCKNDTYFLNLLVEEGGILKPKILNSNIKSNFSMKLFLANNLYFFYQEDKLVNSLGEKLIYSGEAIYELDNHFVIYFQLLGNLKFIFCDFEFNKLSELIITDESHNITVNALSDVLLVRTGNFIYFLRNYNKELKIFKKLEIGKNVLRFYVILKDKEIIIYKLCHKKQEEFIDTNNEPKTGIVFEELKLPIPKINSIAYDPSNELLENSKNFKFDEIKKYIHKSENYKTKKNIKVETHNLNINSICKKEDQKNRDELSQCKKQNINSNDSLKDKISEIVDTPLKDTHLKIDFFNIKIFKIELLKKIDLINKSLLAFFENDNIKKFLDEKIYKNTKLNICEDLLPSLQNCINDFVLNLKSQKCQLKNELYKQCKLNNEIDDNKQQDKLNSINSQIITSKELLKILEELIKNKSISYILHNIEVDSLKKNELIKYKELLEQLCNLENVESIKQLKILATYLIYKISKQITK